MKYYTCFIITLISLYSTSALCENMSLNKQYRAPRAWRIAMTSASYLHDNELTEPYSTGNGFAITREYSLSHNFDLGIHFAYRVFNANSPLNQMVYGLILKHGFGPQKDGEHLFYMSYGLLMQSLRIKNVEGNSMSHDTRFALGYEFFVKEKKYFFELAHNYSRVHYFENKEFSVDHIDFAIGVHLQ